MPIWMCPRTHSSCWRRARSSSARYAGTATRSFIASTGTGPTVLRGGFLEQEL